MQTISCTELAQILEQDTPCRIIDVRTQEEWNSGHMKEAELIPLSVLNVLYRERLSDMFEYIIIVCASGGRAVMAKQVLDAAGYVNARVLEGGHNGWCTFQETK